MMNKTYGDLTCTLSHANFTPSVATAKAYLHSDVILNAAVPFPGVVVAAPPTGSTTSSITSTLPAQSSPLSRFSRFSWSAERRESLPERPGSWRLSASGITDVSI